MKSHSLMLMALLCLSASASLRAENLCNCQKITGSCSASIKINSVKGKAPSYSAEYSITSTVSSCSKVSYYIDGTPYFSILANTNRTNESTFGSSPINMKSFSGLTCQVCEVNSNGGGNNQSAGSSNSNDASAWKRDFNGNWNTDSYVLTISNAETNPTLSAKFNDTGNTENSFTAAFEGRELVFTWSMGMFGNHHCRMRLAGATSASAVCSNFLGTKNKSYSKM